MYSYENLDLGGVKGAHNVHKIGCGTRAHKVIPSVLSYHVLSGCMRGGGKMVVQLVLKSCRDTLCHLGESCGQRAAVKVPRSKCCGLLAIHIIIC